jgi:hypothetical protein
LTHKLPQQLFKEMVGKKIEMAAAEAVAAKTGCKKKQGEKKKTSARTVKAELDKIINKKTLDFLHGLCCMNEEQRGALLDHLTDDGVDLISQCMLNCVYNRCIGGSQQAELCEKLGNKKHIFEYLARDTNSRVKKRKLLKQTGAGLPLVLSTVIPLLTDLLATKTNKSGERELAVGPLL